MTASSSMTPGVASSSPRATTSRARREVSAAVAPVVARSPSRPRAAASASRRAPRPRMASSARRTLDWKRRSEKSRRGPPPSASTSRHGKRLAAGEHRLLALGARDLARREHRRQAPAQAPGRAGRRGPAQRTHVRPRGHADGVSGRRLIPARKLDGQQRDLHRSPPDLELGHGAIEQAVDERGALGRAEALRELDGLVDGHVHGHGRRVQQLPQREAG